MWTRHGPLTKPAMFYVFQDKASGANKAFTCTGFPGGASSEEPACQFRRHKRQGGVQCLGREDPLEKETATHSSILAWEIPRTEEPGGLQSTGPQRVSRKHSFCCPSGSVTKESACHAGDLGLIPGSGGSSGDGNGNPLQHAWLENPMDGGAWRATVHGVTRNQTRVSN